MWLCYTFAWRLCHVSKDITEKKWVRWSLIMKPMEAVWADSSICSISLPSCICFVLPPEDDVGQLPVLSVLRSAMCVSSQCTYSVLMSTLFLLLSLASSMVDTMFPLLNWIFCFLSVGRSKGIDHFIYHSINLSMCTLIYPCMWEESLILMNV